MSINYALLFCLLGAILFLILSSGTLKEKAARLAFAMFWVGLFVWLSTFGHSAFTLGH